MSCNVVTVGGTAVGDSLLRRVLDAVPIAGRKMPKLHFLVVTGPRIDPASMSRHRRVRVQGFAPSLADYLAACDIAVVQGGLTTCMELTAAGTPFVYVPLEHHFEQQLHVRHRLDRYGAGRPMRYAEATDPTCWPTSSLTSCRPSRRWPSWCEGRRLYDC